MRKMLISLLLAGAAATPAIAGPNDWSDRQQAREERQQARENRQAERAAAREQRSADLPSFVAPRERDSQPRPQSFERAQQARPQFDGEALRATRDVRAANRNERIQNVQQRFEQRREAARDARELRQSTRPTPRVMRSPTPLVVSDTPRPGTQPPLRAERRGTPEVQWSTSWRNNNRYNWQDHRRRHRSLFHLGFYYDPFGWGYYPYQIGWRLWPSYFSSRYWINDPWMYRLPYAPAGYRWIRYWNDALLVDTWTGEVVDVIPGFFW